jgi:hypothetical protein
MNQYEFSLTNKKTNARDCARATARTAECARFHINEYYGDEYEVSATPTATRSAHQVMGEIDCSDSISYAYFVASINGVAA